jgi:hypothetical protein
MISPYGRNKRLYLQTGDFFMLYSPYFGECKEFRQLFRPEIYNRENISLMKQRAEVAQEAMSKNENIKFKAYVWH